MGSEGNMDVETNERPDDQQKIKKKTANKSGVKKGCNRTAKKTTSDHGGSSESSEEDGTKKRK